MPWVKAWRRFPRGHFRRPITSHDGGVYGQQKHKLQLPTALWLWQSPFIKSAKRKGYSPSKVKNTKKATLSRGKDRKQKEPIQPNVWISPFEYPRETFLPFYAAESQQTRLSHIPSTGTSCKHISLVDTRHVVGTVHLQKHWPPVRVSPTVGKCNTSWGYHQSVFAYKIEACCVSTTRLYLTSRQVTCVGNHDHLARRAVRVVCRSNAITITVQTLGKCTGHRNGMTIITD